MRLWLFIQTMNLFLVCFFLQVAMPALAYFFPKVHQLSWWDATFTKTCAVVDFFSYLASGWVAICVIGALLLALGWVLIMLLRFAFDVVRFFNAWKGK